MRSVQGIVALLVLLAATRATAFVTLQDGYGNDIYWNKSTIKWYLHPNGSADVPFADAQSALTAAFQAWKGTGCIAKTFSYGGALAVDPQDGIFIKWVESNWDPTVADAAAVAQTWKAAGGVIQHGTVLFNGEDILWTTTEAEDYFSSKSDIQGVGTHELGHCLGLDHTRYQDATMFFAGSTAELRTLTQDDEDGLCYIYGSFSQGKPCDSCKSDSDCKSGYCLQYDDGDFCGADCTTDAQCPETFYCYDMDNVQDQCAAFNGYCTQTGGNIPYGQYCYGAETCESGFCLALPDTAYCSKKCTTDSQCNPLKCISGYCIKGGSTALGGSCSFHSDCKTGLCLQLSTSISVCTQECTSGNDCPSGFECVDDYCLQGGPLQFGQPCSQAMDCQTLRCDNVPGAGKICTQECEDKFDCPNDAPCVSTLCVPAGSTPFGGECGSATDCKTGYCAQQGAKQFCSIPCAGSDAPCPPESKCLGTFCSQVIAPEGKCQTQADCYSGQACLPPPLGEYWGTCVDTCNPFADAGCDAGTECQWTYTASTDTISGLCMPAVANGRELGQACDAGANPCKLSLVCANVGGTGTRCYKDCDVKQNLGCDPDEVCLGLTMESDPRHGVCVCNAISCDEPPAPDVTEQDVAAADPGGLDAWQPAGDGSGPDAPTATDHGKETGSVVTPPQPEETGGDGGCGVGKGPMPALWLLLLMPLIRRRRRVA